MSKCANTAYAEEHQIKMVTDDGLSEAVSLHADAIEDCISRSIRVDGARDFVNYNVADPAEYLAKLIDSGNPQGLILSWVRSAALIRAKKELGAE